MTEIDPGSLPSGDVILANARVVLPDEVLTGAVSVKDGVIVAVDTGAGVPRDAIDCAGDFIAPGLIELHTDNLERHMQPRPGVSWPQTAAVVAHDAELAGTGITTVFDALRVGSVTTRTKAKYTKYAREISRRILDLRAAGALRISHFIHLRAEMCSETLEEEMAEFTPEDRIGIVSVMDHTPGQRQFTDVSQLRTYLKKFGLSSEDMDEHIAFQQELGAANGPRHEAVAVQRARDLGAIVASHDDTTELHVARSAEINVNLAEFPTTLDAAIACRKHGISVMMGAPNVLRGGSHSGNVAAQELWENDLLDILSSDYVPASLLCGAVQLGQAAGNVARGIATVTAAPARAARLTDRGTIEIGQRADLVRFSTDHDVPVMRGTWVRGHRV